MDAKTRAAPPVCGVKEAGIIVLLLCCHIAQLEARASLRTFSGAELLNDRRSLPERVSERRMQEEEEKSEPPQKKPFDPNFISVFSALHDPIAGEAKVFIEMANVDACDWLLVCELRNNGSDEVLRVTGEPWIAFGAQTDDPVARPELRECFVTCPLPSKGLHFDEITVRTEDSSTTVTAELELVEKLPHGKDKGVGMCVGPLFSETPFFADFLAWYTEMGVDHFYVYASVSPWIRDREYKYTHMPASTLPLQLFHDHRVTWRVYYPDQYSVHYYGQALMYNDCAYRARQTQKYLMFNDRDEFLHVKERHPSIKHFLNRQFDRPDLGSITFWGSVYFVHCKLTQVEAMDALPGQPSTVERSTTIPEYWGYSAWDIDHREPNFTGCGDYDCHPKTVVRPEAVKVMFIHYLKDATPAFPIKYKMVPPHVAFTKHLLCNMRGGDWEEDPNALLCPEEYLVHKPGARVVTCPTEEVDAYLEGTWPEGARNRSAAAERLGDATTARRRLAEGARADRGGFAEGLARVFQV